MKTFAKALIGITAVVVLFGAYVLFGPKARIKAVSVDTHGAAERAEAFETIMEGVQGQDFGSNQYKRPDERDASAYEFVNYTITVQNLCILPVEWTQLNLSPVNGDIVLIPGEPIDIAPFRTAAVTASLLTEKDYAGSERIVWIDYYVFGVKQSAVP